MIIVVLGILALVVYGAFSVSVTAGIVALFLVGAAFAGMAKLGAQIEAKDATPESPRHVDKPASKPVKKDHQPPAPHAELVEPWSARTRHHEVAGEFYRSANIARLFRGQRTRDQNGVELHLPAVLVPDPSNPFDKNAVAVYVNRQHVGYVERDDALVFSAPLRALSLESKSLIVESRQWARYDTYRDSLRSRVTLRIPDPGALAPANDLPHNGIVLPLGSTIQVTKEEDHMDAIGPWLDPQGAEVPLAVSLHAIVDIRPRSAGDAVQVQIDGEAVGILSTTSTANLLPLVKHIRERGKVPVARAILKGNALKADVTLHVAKAQDVDPRWIDRLGPNRPSRAAEPQSNDHFE